MRTLDFQDHRRELDDNRYVYAVISRRSQGLSVGINLNPDKVCNFDCPYCQVDRRTPGGPREVVLAQLDRELEHLLALISTGTLWSVAPFNTAAAHLRRVNDIAFAGDGEPTSSHVFEQSVERTVALRRAHGLDDVALQLLTNATLFHRPAVWAGLERLHAADGEIVAKLDAGTEEWFHRVDGTKLPFQRILDNLTLAGRAFGLTLQCMFFSFGDEGPSDVEADAWAHRIDALLQAGAKINLVQVYSVARQPADPSIQPLPTARLHEIALRAERLGVPVTVVPGLPITPEKR